MPKKNCPKKVEIFSGGRKIFFENFYFLHFLEGFGKGLVKPLLKYFSKGLINPLPNPSRKSRK